MIDKFWAIVWSVWLGVFDLLEKLDKRKEQWPYKKESTLVVLEWAQIIWPKVSNFLLEKTRRKKLKGEKNNGD